MYLPVIFVLCLFIAERGDTGRREDPVVAERNRLLNLKLGQDEIKEIRPVLNCHSSYNTDTSKFERGEGKRIYIYKFCMYGKNQDENCVQRCMAEQMGILDLVGFKYAFWNDRATMIGRLRPFFKNGDYKAASELANNIIKTCSGKVLQHPILRTACNTVTLDNFFECLDPIWDCASKPS